MKRALVIFRRDLRIEDNSAVIAAAQEHQLFVCFIFDPVQVTQENKFLSTNALQFMVESLQELKGDIERRNGRLYTFYGNSMLVVKQLIRAIKFNALYVNRDYTPFSIKRDLMLKELCEREQIKFISHDDILLHEPEEVLKRDGGPYTIFNPYFKRANKLTVSPPQTVPLSFYKAPVAIAQVDLDSQLKLHAKILSTHNAHTLQGGRKHALKILRELHKFSNYSKTRDYPALNTTLLSAHLKFGTVSVREVYHAIKGELGANHPLIRQLYWRDFYTHIAYHFPNVFGSAFKKKYNHIEWSYNQEHFERWCFGETGFPIVDAGMKELNETGFMHNRVRMITASFLVKDLHLDWQLGERYFARKLVDYDPSVNNGNWQWIASTGSDAQPYFRIFNPWLQQKKFDPECHYIKKWLPQLQDLTPREIHNYAHPMLDHTAQARKALLTYKTVYHRF